MFPKDREFFDSLFLCILVLQILNNYFREKNRNNSIEFSQENDNLLNITLLVDHRPKILDDFFALSVAILSYLLIVSVLLLVLGL